MIKNFLWAYKVYTSEEVIFSHLELSIVFYEFVDMLAFEILILDYSYIAIMLLINGECYKVWKYKWWFALGSQNLYMWKLKFNKLVFIIECLCMLIFEVLIFYYWYDHD